ncbi:WhiB family transcriptional regulator [Mycobacterium sp. 4D054]|uniref:WhiB family transcriptional regulator n=1 Tax=Mycobacterium sp. 4D054 TaxID=3457440 RepID=UPI0011DA08B0|nr:WhiB family transcriptional regulator [Mycobacterium sp.]MCB1286677.1 WhiB family transcriptional regulator [Mycobacterium sp.]TXH12427.1 MAG: transcription factor WhiB [Gammaproteobacteria bacterium]
MNHPAEPDCVAATVPLPCHADPDQWFDPAARTQSLAACLRCPRRRWCARRALTCRPSWGMWAGVWIDGRFTPVAHRLSSIAADTPPPRATGAVAASHRPLVRSPVRPESPPPAGVRCSTPAPAAALVWARASGHCEIMAPDCRLTADSLESRLGEPPGKDTASTLFAACVRCANSIASLDPKLARRLGYRVCSRDRAPDAPFLWRQQHWVILNTDGACGDASPPGPRRAGRDRPNLVPGAPPDHRLRHCMG